MHRTDVSASERRQSSRYRPPIGIPAERPGRWGLLASVLAHALLILLVLGPLLAYRPPVVSRLAGGNGAVGGGGGGHLGMAASRAGPEGVRYVRVAPPTPVSTPAPPVARVTPPPPVVKLPPPVEKPHVQQTQVVTPPSISPQSAAPSVVAIAAGAGAGTDGTNGAGPGTGGGEGTGTGPGRGSGIGPGTGGGLGTIYPATPDFAVIPPLPVPKHLQGKTVELRFTVDASGRVVNFDFDPTGDSGYDRQLRERLGAYHFRPAHKTDGTPVSSVFVTQFVL